MENYSSSSGIIFSGTKTQQPAYKLTRSAVTLVFLPKAIILHAFETAVPHHYLVDFTAYPFALLQKWYVWVF